MACGLATALLLRAALGGDDPASSQLAGLLFGLAVLAVALAAGQPLERPSLRGVAALGGAVLVAFSLSARPAVGLHLVAPLGPLAVWSALVTLIACAEEALFRGALFATVQTRWGAAAALAVSSAAFALVHLPLYGAGAMPLDLAVGLWLGGLRLLTGGLAAPATAHAVADLAAGWVG